MVDGLDGCGKDTHAENIRRILEADSERVTVVSHPSRRLFGRLSKRSLESSGPIARILATLFFIADVLMSVRWLRKQPAGTAVFVRYLLGTAYLPSALAPYGYKFFEKMLPFPDIAFFIDIEPEVAARRIVARGHAREMFETPAKLAAVRKVAKALTSHGWVVIDNSIDGDRPFKEAEVELRKRLRRDPTP